MHGGASKWVNKILVIEARGAPFSGQFEGEIVRKSCISAELLRSNGDLRGVQNCALEWGEEVGEGSRRLGSRIASPAGYISPPKERYSGELTDSGAQYIYVCVSVYKEEGGGCN